jgi:hypothetical protein
VLRGNDRNNTKLIFDLNHGNGNMFDFKGIIGIPPLNVNQPIAKDDTTLTVVNTMGTVPGDWLHLYGNDVALTTSAWAYGTVGQIVQVKAVNGNTLNLHQKIRRSYDVSYGGQLRPIAPIQGAGIECMYIQRKDSTISQTNNINFDYAVNCWVIGVESDSTNFCHIAMTNSAHLLVRGNYLHHAHAYGGGGQGYGVVAQYTSGDCVVENNIFEHLRHSMLVQAGANGNVFGYNYSKDPYWDEPPFPTNSAGDIVCHGNYPYMNLFEGNIVQHIVIDNSHGINGPHNTFFRNRAEGYGIFMNNTPATDSVTFVGNEITNPGLSFGQFTKQGAGHFEHGNNHKGTIKPTGTNALPENFLHYAFLPGFWPSTGGFLTIGTPYSYGNFISPAQQLHASNQMTDCRANPVPETDFVVDIHNYQSTLSAYPNPANAIVTFQYDTKGTAGTLHISICDMTGRQVANLNCNNGNTQWNATRVPAGLYIYQLNDGNTTLQTGKLVVTQ